MEDKKVLAKKLSQIMSAVQYIQKRGYNKFHKYKYATEADVNEKVREELVKVNVIMIPNVISHETKEHKNRQGNTEYIVTVNMEFRFIDGDSGEEIVFNMSGSGQDAGDKGIFKAMTGAQKYALMKVFMIPTGDDPEQDYVQDEHNKTNNDQQETKFVTAEQAEEFKQLALQYAEIHGRTLEDVYKVFGIGDLRSLPEGLAIEYIEKIKGWIKQASQESA